MKNGLVLLLGCAIALSAGVAAAQDGRQAQETRTTTGDGTGRPQRPEVQTTDGNYSSCDETGGGLECDFTMCGVDHESSRCETWVTNTSNEDLP